MGKEFFSFEQSLSGNVSEPRQHPTWTYYGLCDIIHVDTSFKDSQCDCKRDTQNKNS